MFQCNNLGLLEVQRLLGGEAAVPLPNAEQRVHRDGVGPGVVHLLAGDVGASYEVHGTTIFKLAFRNIWNDLQWVPNKVIHGFEPTVLDGAVRHEPADEDDEKHEVRCEGLPQP